MKGPTVADDQIATMLMFAGRAEEAIGLYTSLFDDSGIDFIERYGPDYPGPAGKVVHARFRLNGQLIMATDSAVEQPFTFTPSTSLFVTCPDAAEVDRLHAGLAEGGSVMMELDRYPFATRYAWVQDRFGVSWQLFFA
jgi:predicted 3-demethylubiquinone-9 3-methyltransferase (glyoxalase superfamily)